MQKGNFADVYIPYIHKTNNISIKLASEQDASFFMNNPL